MLSAGCVGGGVGVVDDDGRLDLAAEHDHLYWLLLYECQSCVSVSVPSSDGLVDMNGAESDTYGGGVAVCLFNLNTKTVQICWFDHIFVVKICIDLKRFFV